MNEQEVDHLFKLFGGAKARSIDRNSLTNWVVCKTFYICLCANIYLDLHIDIVVFIGLWLYLLRVLDLLIMHIWLPI